MWDRKMQNQVRSRANANYWKMQDQTFLTKIKRSEKYRTGKCGTEKCRTKLKFILAQLFGAVPVSLAVVVVAVSDTLLYFITTAQKSHMTKNSIILKAMSSAKSKMLFIITFIVF